MTTEDDFHAKLDVEPDNHTVRLVFADWLQERGDPRAEGYRALGVLKLRPIDHVTFTWFDGGYQSGNDPPSDLPSEWFDEVQGGDRNQYFEPTATFPERREAEEAAALAFANLPAERRAELLQGKLVAA